MNMLSKDTLHPILVETIQAVNKVTDRDFENKGKIVQWLITLNQMRAVCVEPYTRWGAVSEKFADCDIFSASRLKNYPPSKRENCTSI